MNEIFTHQVRATPVEVHVSANIGQGRASSVFISVQEVQSSSVGTSHAMLPLGYR